MEPKHEEDRGVAGADEQEHSTISFGPAYRTSSTNPAIASLEEDYASKSGYVGGRISINEPQGRRVARDEAVALNELLLKVLRYEPEERTSAEDLLQARWFKGHFEV
jgi:hypothetical protein